MEYQIRKRAGSRPAWQYRGNVLHSWSYFPDKDAESIEGMRRHLQQYGDNPTLKFVDDTGQPTTFAEVRRLPNGKTTVRLNGGEREHELHIWDFWPIQEQYKFFRDRQSDEVNSMALTKPLHDAMKFYKEQAPQETKDEYASILSEKINSDAVTSILKTREGEGVKVFFNG